MAYNGAGLFSRVYNWVTDRTNGVKISAERMDAEMDGFATGLSNAITKDGQTTPTANIPLGGKRITSLGDPSDATDGATKQYVDNVASGLGKRATARVASTANIDLTDMDDGDTIDGVVVATGDIVLVKNQSTASQNGVYVVAASGAAARHTDFDTWAEHVGSIISVTAGTAGANTLWVCMVNSGGTLGVTAVTYSNSTPTISYPISIANGGTGQVTATAGFDALSPVTTRGDLIYRNASNNARLAVGAANAVLSTDGTDPAWRTITAALDAALGSTQGQVLYRGASAWAALSPGTSGQVLASGGAAANPSWSGSSTAVNYQPFSADGTWTKPSGFSGDSMVVIQCWGGGGSGGRAGNSDGGGGGGGGAFVERRMLLSVLASTVAVTIGNGGTAATADNTDGTAGGNTTFGAHVTSYGGGGGSGGSTATNTGGGGGSGGGSMSAGATPTTLDGVGGGAPTGGSAGSGNSSGAPGSGGNSTEGGGGGGGAYVGGASQDGGAGGLSASGGGGGGGGADAAGTGGAGGRSLRAGGGGGGGSNSGTGGAGGASVEGGVGGAGATGSSAATAGTVPGGAGGGSETGDSGAGAKGMCKVWVIG